MKTLILLFSLFLGCSGFAYNHCQIRKNQQHRGNGPLRSGAENLRSDTIDVLNYSIYLDFTKAPQDSISGHCKVNFEALMDVSTISLDLLQLQIDSIKSGTDHLNFGYNDTLIVVELGTILLAGQEDSLTVYYKGTPQTDPSGWGGFYMTSGYYYNLGVGFQSIPHNYGRVWHPCFDNFAERATYDFTILTGDGATAYCNGTRTSVQNVGTDSLLTQWKLSTAIPTYLASVAVCTYTHVEQVYSSVLQGIDIPIWLAAKASDTTNLKASFINLNAAMAGFENYYGPYVWERIGYVLVPFNAGAMEHATNIAYPLVTINGALTYETLMAHELSHHWWGDWVTCAKAEEMWINEGMAVYSEHLFTEYVYGQDAYMDAMRDNHYHVLHRAHVDDSGHYALNNVPLKFTYGEHSYRKAADVMHSLRNYMGDANFFAGLQLIQTDFGGQNISSEQFRDKLNEIAGVNVTDFFDGWILQSGFSHFSIADFTVSPSAGNYDVTVLIGQKLKGAPNYHNNVNLQLTFMDANWNVHHEDVNVSGPFEQLNFSLPINPVFVGVNMDEKLNDATTATTEVISTPGNKIYPYSNIRITITEMIDSSFLRVEHNWVYADQNGAPENVQVSMDRYWNIHGIDLENITGTIRFNYNGKNESSGDFDNQLMVNLGGQIFREDSLVLLYRPDALSNWEIHPDYEINYTGSHVDKTGFMTANYFAPGQYTFGYRTNSVNILEYKVPYQEFSVYPNPTYDSATINLTEWPTETFDLLVYSTNGKLINKSQVTGGTNNTVSFSNTSAGTYILVIQDSKGIRSESKLITIH